MVYSTGGDVQRHRIAVPGFALTFFNPDRELFTHKSVGDAEPSQHRQIYEVEESALVMELVEGPGLTNSSSKVQFHWRNT